MATTTRTQKRYDHRLRDLVRTTQDVSYAVQYGVPRSTARGWLIPEELEAARQEARQARAEANRKRDCETCELLAASLN